MALASSVQMSAQRKSPIKVCRYINERSFDFADLLKGSWRPLGVHGSYFENRCPEFFLSVLMCAYSVYVCLFFKQENMVSYSGWGEGSIVL